MKKARIFVSLFFLMNLLACSESKDNNKKNNGQDQNQIQVQQKETSDSQFNYPVINQNAYTDLDSQVDKKIALQGSLTGEKFEHLVYYHPPFDEIAHFNLSSYSSFYKDMPHIVIYFKRKTDLSRIYQEFLDKPAVIYGTLGKVTGSMLKADPEKIKKRQEHTIYFVDVENIEFIK